MAILDEAAMQRALVMSILAIGDSWFWYPSRAAA